MKLETMNATNVDIAEIITPYFSKNSILTTTLTSIATKEGNNKLAHKHMNLFHENK